MHTRLWQLSIQIAKVQFKFRQKEVSRYTVVNIPMMSFHAIR